MNITAAMVKELRERTGSGMMECKKALQEANGDMEAAVELMRKAGLAKADKKAGRVAAEGRISVKTSADNKRAVIVEVNCETDFVAKGDDFVQFADNIVQTALDSNVGSLEQLLATVIPSTGSSVEDTRRALIAKIGENINVRRFDRIVSEKGIIASYLHGTRIGVLVELIGGDQELGRDIAMHIAASNPLCVDEQGVPPETLAKEREIAKAQAEAEGKPANIVEKMVEGKLRKFIGEVTLLGQPFVKDPDQTVGKLLSSRGASVGRFVRFEVGEGIEKTESNFAEEVMAQVRNT
ncbi:translation elongation factor Ts [Methylocaldum szegediense]|uniref:Elongation factor Ts n=1 Tax=Methylocaldum szegediense TaxID=73780 RepID=A0ABM9I5R9_9GAMM|nr:translation elongation factor Ts [Methylocaldum szegediense]CAI8909940.1 protein chain elongation factor EF-Ts [Methylocaldum szegediense]